jgi:hypothetical protein
MRELASPFRTYPIVRLTDDGIDWGVQPKSGDEVGYGMHPYLTDDCLQAAIATCTQVPIEQVPILMLHQRLERGEDPDEISRIGWTRIVEWAGKRGLALAIWEYDELPVPRRRWIGVAVPRRSARGYRFEDGTVISAAEAGQFADHCFVMAHDQLLFDPACSVKSPPGTRVKRYDLSMVAYGISFEHKEDQGERD